MQHVFACLGVFGGSDFSTESVAYILSTTVQATSRSIEFLLARSLVQASSTSRWRLHPLLRDYARERLVDQENYMRMVTYFVDYVDQYQSSFPSLRLEAENILYALDQAHARQLGHLLIEGVSKFYQYLHTQRLNEIAQMHLLRALAASQQLGDDQKSIFFLFLLAETKLDLAEIPNAQSYAKEALILAERVGDTVHISKINRLLAATYADVGELDVAEKYATSALLNAQQIDDERLVSRIFNTLAVILLRSQKFSEAEVIFLQALAVARRLGEQATACTLLTNLGDVAKCQEDYVQYERYSQEGITLAQEFHLRNKLAILLYNYAESVVFQGDSARGEVLCQESLRFSREVDDQFIISWSLMLLGLIRYQKGQFTEAENVLHQAIASIGEGENYNHFISDCLYHLGMVYLKDTKTERAESTLLHALKLVGDKPSWNWGDILFGLACVTHAQGDLETANTYAERSIKILLRAKPKQAIEVQRWLKENIYQSRKLSTS
jgi:tetratricopeptide (TPR) repeat protein